MHKAKTHMTKKPKSLWKQWTSPRKHRKMSPYEKAEKDCIKRISKDICNEVDRKIIAEIKILFGLKRKAKV